MRSFSTIAVTSSAVALLLAASVAAHADAIDGDWCFAAKNLYINGSKIRTPGGTEMTGEYTRHTFNYTVPSSEPDAGVSIAMQLISEETMSVSQRSDKPTESQIWKRCKPVS